MTAQIYVACLSSYNAGRLYGKWIEVSDSDTMHKEVARMLRLSPEPHAEEWAVHDYEYDVSLSSFGECPDFDDLVAVVEMFEDMDEQERAAVVGCVHHKDIVRMANDPHRLDLSVGIYADEFEALEEHNAFNGVPDHVVSYIDERAMFRDYFMDYMTGRLDDGCIYVLQYH